MRAGCSLDGRRPGRGGQDPKAAVNCPFIRPWQKESVLAAARHGRSKKGFDKRAGFAYMRVRQRTKDTVFPGSSVGRASGC